MISKISEDEISHKKDMEFLEWIEDIDHLIYQRSNPKYLIYYDNHEFYYDPMLFSKEIQVRLISKQSNLQIHIVSHNFEDPKKEAKDKESGHVGCIFIEGNKAYYYDSNGLKDSDNVEYYDRFEKQLCEELKKYGIEYVPYRWKKGIQVIQSRLTAETAVRSQKEHQTSTEIHSVSRPPTRRFVPLGNISSLQSLRSNK